MHGKTTQPSKEEMCVLRRCPKVFDQDKNSNQKVQK
jgi:hypothetical protein